MKLELVQLDDWEGLYVDGVCVAQDHRRTLSDWLRKQVGPVTIESYRERWLSEAAEAHVMNEGNMPTSLADLREIETRS